MQYFFTDTEIHFSYLRQHLIVMVVQTVQRYNGLITITYKTSKPALSSASHTLSFTL